ILKSIADLRRFITQLRRVGHIPIACAEEANQGRRQIKSESHTNNKMKMKHVLIALAALLGVVGAWGTRLAWRAHKQIVSLNVRNAPLADVLRKIEWQTWKKIHAEKGLDARITLTLKDKPLAYVLDRVAEQAGAQWSTLHAVYDSRRALNKLKSAL